MKKIIILIGIIFLVLPLTSSLTITNTTIEATNSDYKIFVNDSINLDEMRLNSDINIYNLTSQGIFTNLNAILSSEIIFYGLINPNNDIKWDDGTIIARDVSTTFNILVTALRYIIVGNFDIATGGASSSTPTIRFNKLNYTYSDWQKGGINNLFIYTFDDEDKPFDVDSVNVTTELDSEIKIFRLGKGEYKAEVLINENVSEVELELSGKYFYKEIQKILTIELKEPTNTDKLKNALEVKISRFSKLIDWTKEIKLKVFFVILGMMIFLLGLTTYIIYSRRKEGLSQQGDF